MAQTAEQIVLSHEAWEEYREIYRADPWEFALDICGFDKLVERFHKPIIYLLTHRTALMIETLKSDLQSAFIVKLKAALKHKGLDYRKPEHFDSIDAFCLKLNLRILRKGGKTSCGEAAILWDITVDPNHAWAIVSRDDPSAQAMCSMLGKIILSEAYGFFFPERVPEQPSKFITQTFIQLKGRTKQIPQPCVTAGGVDSGWVSMHFDRIYCDDLVGRENKSTAKLKVVHEFQANKLGLKMPEWDAPFYDFSIGTRWARNDDSSVLDRDPNCLSIYVPIEERTEPVTFANMMEAGEPTLPEWFDEEKIAKEKADYMKNADGTLGAVALLANLFLTIASDGAKIFIDAVVDARKFEWDDDHRSILRLADPKRANSKILSFTPRQLERRGGADPAESMTGDPWAVSIIGRDPLGTHYQLVTMKGHGADGFLDALLYINEHFDPEEIGIEKAAMQGWVLIAVQKDSRFAHIIHKFVPVSTNGESKRGRAKNLVAAPLEMGTFYLNPDDQVTPQDMKDWDPDNKYADDASIDSLGIAMALFRTPALVSTSKEVEEMAKLDNERYQKAVDPDFGVPIENVMAEDDWAIDDFDNEAEWSFDEEVAL